MSRISHVPGLDGLRGVAVVGVLLFHANGLLRGGYLGVDLFFVLSGFLITSILVREHAETGRIDLRAFWVRRFRRLMPALLALIPAIALYAKLLASPAELGSLRADALSTIAYVANWRSIFAHRSYWEMFASPSPLEHTWSLAIEEQFYLVWPLVVAAALALGKRRALAVVTGVLGLASVVAMLVLYEEGRTMRVYLGTDTRGAAILVGAGLALAGLERVPRPLGFAAGAVLAAAWLLLDGQSELLYRGGFWITELACAVLIAACAGGDGIGRVFAWRPLRAIGTISYGVYLWHWPVYVVLSDERVHLGLPALLALRLAVTFAIAIVSYRFVERPIREHGVLRPLLVVPGAVAVAIAFVLVSTRPVAAAAAPLAPRTAPEPKLAAAPIPRAPVPLGSIPPPGELPPDTLRVLVLGDSVGLALGARMHWASLATTGTFAEQRAVGDCSILDGVAPVFSMSGEPHGNGNCAASWKADVEELHPDVALVVIGGAYFSRVRVDGKSRGVCHPGWAAPYRAELARLLGELAPAAKRRAVLLAAYPVGKWQTPTRNDDVDCYNRILRDAAASAGADVIDLNAFVCPEKRTCTLKSQDAPIRPDGLHFDGLGAEETARWVIAQVHALAGADAGTP